jgi:SAM-dependent methyltransferase
VKTTHNGLGGSLVCPSSAKNSPPAVASSHSYELPTFSFRDPAGVVFRTKSRIFRYISSSALSTLKEFLSLPVTQELIASSKLVSTWAVNEDPDLLHVLHSGHLSACEADGQIVEHERIWFPSYPYEWPPEMLFSAAELTLDLAQTALKQGFGLKDATPYNILFRGPKPVFVDILSFEKRDPGDSAWLPYAQFLRTFILPLLMNKYFHMRMDQIFLCDASGLAPETVYYFCTWPQRLRPPFLTTITLPTWLGRRMKTGNHDQLYRPRLQQDPEKVRFILERQFRHLRRLLHAVRPPRTRSAWSSYTKQLSYTDEEFKEKTKWVAAWACKIAPQKVLDLGCNTGHFSEITARAGAQVVAADLDPVVVGETWTRAARANLNILPLMVNIAHPTPPVGWRNAEYSSFLERATGQFDLLLMLALLHHLLVTERVPLTEIVDIAAELTTSYAVIEFVSKDDPLFRQLTRGREALHESFTQQAFEAACQQRFYIIDKRPVKGHLRWLYLLKRL